MRVVATAVGIDGQGHVRQIGDVFNCPKNAQGNEVVKASWYHEVPQERAPQEEQRKGGKGNRLIEE